MDTQILIITSNSGNKVCISKDITVGTSEEINSHGYSNVITLPSEINCHEKIKGYQISNPDNG